MSALTRGQAAFLNELYLNCGPALYRYARHFLGERPYTQGSVQDALQETWLRAVRDVDRLISHEKPDAWLLLTLRHVLLDGMRTERTHWRFFVAQDVQSAEELQQLIIRDRAELSAHEWLRQVEAAAARVLTAGELRTFRDHFFSGYTMAETARLEQVPLTTVRGRIRRIRLKLRRHFGMA